MEVASVLGNSVVVAGGNADGSTDGFNFSLAFPRLPCLLNPSPKWGVSSPGSKKYQPLLNHSFFKLYAVQLHISSLTRRPEGNPHKSFVYHVFVHILLAAEVTNTRVAFFSLGSLSVCIASGLWQLWYLRKFFQRKKLL